MKFLLLIIILLSCYTFCFQNTHTLRPYPTSPRPITVQPYPTGQASDAEIVGGIIVVLFIMFFLTFTMFGFWLISRTHTRRREYLTV